MKNVLITRGLLPFFAERRSFLDRTTVAVHTAARNDEVLKIHRKENLDLIIAELDLPGIRTESLFDIIRNDARLRAVSTIIVCEDTLANRERCRQSRANAVLTFPVDTALLHLKTQQFLMIAPRMAYRAAVAVAISGTFRERPVPFWSENVSSSGMLIRTAEPLGRGDGVFLSFFLADGTHVSGYGEIVRIVRRPDHADPFQYGVRFTNIAERDKGAIVQAVERARGMERGAGS